MLLPTVLIRGYLCPTHRSTQQSSLNPHFFFNPTAASETADQPSLLKYFLYLILKQYINLISSKSLAIPSQSLRWL